MKKEKLSKILTSVVLIALGVLIAIFGVGAIDIYLGVVACVAGAVILIDTIYLLSRKEKIVATPFVVSLVFFALGITLFTHYISFASFVNLLVVVILGTGAGLLCYGVYLLAKKETSSGVLNVAVGVVSLVLSILYIANVGNFEKIFWIIAGILIAVYGALGLVFAIAEKK